jgi:hypothetical protein
MPAWSGYKGEMEWIHWRNSLNGYTCKELSTEWIPRSVYVGGSVADQDPGSGIWNKFFPDPGSQTEIFESLMPVFG